MMVVTAFWSAVCVIFYACSQICFGVVISFFQKRLSMGIPVDGSPDICAYDNVCFPSGSCPFWCILNISGVWQYSVYELPVPNGTFYLPQITNNIWGCAMGDFAYQVVMNGSQGSARAMLAGGQIAFRGLTSTSCARGCSNRNAWLSYGWADGFAFWGFSSTANIPGTYQDYAKSLGISLKSKTFVEPFAVSAKGLLRFSNKFDGTCVSIRPK
jgi:hypothetical protein